jgi:toxin FitB
LVIEVDFVHPVIAFDETAAVHPTNIAIWRKPIGRPIAAADAQIATIARRHGATLATPNVGDFTDAGVTLFNHWKHEADRRPGIAPPVEPYELVRRRHV